MRIYKSLFILLIALFPYTALASIPERPYFTGYVYDYAQVISASDELLINNYSKTTHNADAGQVIVVTVDSLDNLPIENYALQLFNSWGIGSAEKSDGILILFAPTERQVQLTTGSGIDDQFTGEDCGNLIDMYGIPLMAKNKFSEGIVSLTKSVCIKCCLDRSPLFDDIEMLLTINTLN